MLRRLLLTVAPRHQAAPLVRLDSTRSSGENQAGGNGPSSIPLNEYHEASDTALEELSERLDDILESRFDQGADVSLNNGVLTVVIDESNTYVINKQTPNRQIWLSSPVSGPMRFDYVSGNWVEKNSRVEIKQLLSKELSKLLNKQIEC